MIRSIERQRRQNVAALAAGLLLLAYPGGLQGQEPEPLEVGRSISSELTPSLPLFGGTPSRTFRFDAREGRRYEITVRSTSFEAEVRVGRMVSGATDYIGTATEQGVGGGAVLQVEAPRTETLLVLVRAMEDATGPFTLAIREAAAGEVRPLVVNEPGAGYVGPSAESVHAFTASTGEELEIIARSTDFDTYLEIGRLSGGEFTVLEEDDDGAGGTDSRVYFTAPASGEYRARVTAYGGAEGGAYAITLAPPTELPAPRRLTLAAEAEGRLDETSPRLYDEIPFADWVISAQRGERVRIDAQSTDFDTYLSVGRMEGREFVELAFNDDWRGPDLGETDSRVVLIARQDGEYVARVRAYAEDQAGEYTILATALEPARVDPVGGALPLGSPVTGTLTDTDAVLDDGAVYQEWRVEIPSPGRYEFLLTSTDFDAYLILGEERDGEFEEIASNDDWAGGANRTDSRIMTSLPEAGEYILRVRPFLDGAGDYELTARPGAAARATPAGGVIRTGETVEGELREDDSRIDDSPYQEWRIDLSSGARVTVTVDAEDFDAYLAIGQGSAGAFSELAADDDSGGGTNPRIDFVAPAAGEYVIRIRPFFGDAAGEYNLSVTATQ